ncbi:hypothetical protein CYLTODRAFT_421438 [Cylindrobasidium torrendii FP15055 ss-10]|uniref:F-box domain-containing protein n=1 Tax=Cylindrobasidium torrendii FP15055 ss-10 TaxID=1314674 RepID=A0A0D7BEH9_9AGAR|nr:hypothetical protein CYLTODRAFT_421438 [Cylindrobasidium torrendii FP15055 ss-10]
MLSPEVKREIMILSIHALKAWLKESIELNFSQTTVADAMYDYVEVFDLELFRWIVLDSVSLSDTNRLNSFLMSVPTVPFVGAAVVRLTLHGRLMGGTLDWAALLIARTHMPRLKILTLMRLQLDRSILRGLIEGLTCLNIQRCTLSPAALVTAINVVPSVLSQRNTFTETDTHFSGPIKTDRLVFSASSSKESTVYRLVLSHVQRVKRLTVYGVKGAWDLRGWWTTMETLKAVHGLPKHFIIHPRLRRLTIVIRDTWMAHFLAIFPVEYSGSMAITVEVSVGTSANSYQAFWEKLHRSPCSEVLDVVFMLRGRSAEQEIKEHSEHLEDLLAESNKIGGDILCPLADIEVRRCHCRDRYCTY